MTFKSNPENLAVSSPREDTRFSLSNTVMREVMRAVNDFNFHRHFEITTDLIRHITELTGDLAVVSQNARTTVDIKDDSGKTTRTLLKSAYVRGILAQALALVNKKHRELAVWRLRVVRKRLDQDVNEYLEIKGITPSLAIKNARDSLLNAKSYRDAEIAWSHICNSVPREDLARMAGLFHTRQNDQTTTEFQYFDKCLISCATALEQALAAVTAKEAEDTQDRTVDLQSQTAIYCPKHITIRDVQHTIESQAQIPLDKDEGTYTYHILIDGTVGLELVLGTCILNNSENVFEIRAIRHHHGMQKKLSKINRELVKNPVRLDHDEEFGKLIQRSYLVVTGEQDRYSGLAATTQSARRTLSNLFTPSIANKQRLGLATALVAAFMVCERPTSSTVVSANKQQVAETTRQGPAVPAPRNNTVAPIATQNSTNRSFVVARAVAQPETITLASFSPNSARTANVEHALQTLLRRQTKVQLSANQIHAIASNSPNSILGQTRARANIALRAKRAHGETDSRLPTWLRSGHAFHTHIGDTFELQQVGTVVQLIHKDRQGIELYTVPVTTISESTNVAANIEPTQRYVDPESPAYSQLLQTVTGNYDTPVTSASIPNIAESQAKTYLDPDSLAYQQFMPATQSRYWDESKQQIALTRLDQNRTWKQRIKGFWQSLFR